MQWAARCCYCAQFNILQSVCTKSVPLLLRMRLVSPAQHIDLFLVFSFFFFVPTIHEPVSQFKKKKSRKVCPSLVWCGAAVGCSRWYFHPHLTTFQAFTLSWGRRGHWYRLRPDQVSASLLLLVLLSPSLFWKVKQNATFSQKMQTEPRRAKHAIFPSIKGGLLQHSDSNSNWLLLQREFVLKAVAYSLAQMYELNII